jgi:hypothetical protein
MRYDWAKILAALKDGKAIPADVVAEVRRCLELGADEDELYRLARILAKSVRPTDHDVKLVERYLVPETEDWGLHGVVLALCHDWELTSRFSEVLVLFCDPRRWLSHQSTAIAALGCLGEYLAVAKDPHLVGKLIQYIDADSGSMAAMGRHSIKAYRDHVWHALDWWMRGPEALVRRTSYEPGSEADLEVRKRFRKSLT